jgi:hypothetical protein
MGYVSRLFRERRCSSRSCRWGAPRPSVSDPQHRSAFLRYGQSLDHCGGATWPALSVLLRRKRILDPVSSVALLLAALHAPFSGRTTFPGRNY